MEKTNTKEEILKVALDLFSVKGYEASSVSMIADAIGIRKASLYSHYENKQAILNALVQQISDKYDQHSMFANVDWEDPEFINSKQELSVQQIAAGLLEHIRYIIHDPAISKARKMLVIEQFSNPELSRLQTKQNYDDVLQYHVGMFRFLMKIGKIREGDPELLAAEYCLPITVWLNLCDREPEREPEVMKMIEKHVYYFFGLYQI